MSPPCIGSICSPASRGGYSPRSPRAPARCGVAPGDVLIEEGAIEAHLYAIVEGRVRVHRGDQTLVELGPGTTVGELAALVPEPRSASVTALEPTLALRVDKAVLDDLLVDWPELAYGVIAALVRGCAPAPRTPTRRDEHARPRAESSVC